MNNQFIWPNVFTDEDFSYDENDERQKKRALADGLVGWGNSMAGAKIPTNFGMGMVKIGLLLGESPVYDNLMKVADEYQARTRTL